MEITLCAEPNADEGNKLVSGSHDDIVCRIMDPYSSVTGHHAFFTGEGVHDVHVAF